MRSRFGLDQELQASSRHPKLPLLPLFWRGWLESASFPLLGTTVWSVKDAVLSRQWGTIHLLQLEQSLAYRAAGLDKHSAEKLTVVKVQLEEIRKTVDELYQVVEGILNPVKKKRGLDHDGPRGSRDPPWRDHGKQARTTSPPSKAGSRSCKDENEEGEVSPNYDPMHDENDFQLNEEEPLHDEEDKQPEEDEEPLPSDMEPQHVVEVKMGQRSRRSYNLSYVEPTCTIADLHYEVARVTRRNAWSFTLSLDSAPLEGTDLISDHGKELHIRGDVIPGWEQWGADQPPISASRGGTPSSLRARLGRRIAKTAADIPDPTELLQQLWACEARTFTEFKGDNDALVKICRSLIVKHKAMHSRQGWRLETPAAPEDPWQKSDPWATAAVRPNKPTHHALDLADKEDADAFEQAELETKFITNAKQVLPQRKRAKHTMDEPAVVLCTQQQFPAYVHGLGDTVPVMILANKLSAEQRERHKAVRTQVVVKVDGNPKVMNVEAVTIGKEEISAMQNAFEITAVDADVIVATLRLVREEVSDEDFQAAMQKQKLSLFVGTVFQHLTFTARRSEDQEASLRWTVECPRKHLPSLLKSSGHRGCTVTIQKEEESKLKVELIFVSATSVKAVFDSVQQLNHLGVCGPTKAGLYIVRAPQGDVGAIRQAVLPETSPYAQAWDLIVTMKYEGKFPAQFSMQTIASSLFMSLKWTCIPLSQKSLGKKYRLITFGAAQAPASTQVVFGGEIIILKLVVEKPQHCLTTAFKPVAPVSSASASASSPSIGVTELLDETCGRKLASMENTLDAKFSEWQLATQHRLSTQLMSAIDDKFNEKHAENEAQLGSLMDALQQNEKTIQQVRHEANQAWQNATTQLKTLEQSCRAEFQRVDSTLAEQTKAIQATTSTIQEQFRSLGADLMDQIAKMSTEAQAASKRRRPDAGSPVDEDMDNRGGMLSTGAWQQALVERLRRTLQHHLEATVDLDEDKKHVQEAEPLSAGTEAEQEQLQVDDQPKDKQQVEKDTDVRAVTDPYLHPLEYLDDFPGGGESDQRHADCGPAEADRSDEMRIGNKIIRCPRGLKCSAKNEVDVADFLSEAWDEAILNGWHIWTLLKEHTIISSVESLAYIPQARRESFFPGYSIACWTCGLTYHARRRRAVLTTSCAAARLIQHADPWGTRVSARSCLQPGFFHFLERLNKDPARVAKHWPNINERLIDGRIQVWLLCGKCGKQVYHANKHAFLKERCGQDARLMEALPLPDGQVAHEEPCLLHPPVRGGQSCKISSLNIGSLRGKEMLLPDLGKDVTMLQETCIHPARQQSISTALAQVGGTIAFAQIADQDLRTRGQVQGVRLGAGVAIAAFHPWRVCKMEAR